VNSSFALLCSPSAIIAFVFNNFLAQWLLVMTEAPVSFVSSHIHILRWRRVALLAGLRLCCYGTATTKDAIYRTPG